jgi:predicted outer membrane repeat protein
LYSEYSSINLTGGVFEENTAGSGGGIYLKYNSGLMPDIILVEVDFIRNTASDEGGGLWFDTYDVDMVQVLFQGNVAGGEGGGLYSYESNLDLVNALFSGNQGSHGGGMFTVYTDLNLWNATFSGNHATTEGGGILNEGSEDFQLVNFILWGNSALSGPQLLNTAGGKASLDYGALQGVCPSGATCTQVTGSDPCFSRTPDPGADSTWGTADDDYGDLRLTACSSAIDAGNNAALPLDTYDLDGDSNTTEPLPYDLEDNPRRLDITSIADTGAGTAPIVDFGAYETQSVTYCIFIPLVLR